MSVIMAVGFLPMAAVASDTFTDVPDTSQFHDAINNLYDARVTRGCTTSPPLQYCPTDPVNRQQMAAFLNRGLGRVTSDSGSANITVDSDDVNVATLTLSPGGLTGGTGFVLVTGSVSAYTSSAGTCPCEVSVRVRNTTAGVQPGLWQFFDVTDTATPTGFRNGSGTMSWVFEVPSGVDQTFALLSNVDMTASPGFLTLQGQLTAVYVPFGGTGGSTLSTFGTESAPTDGRGD
jgi:hypothetical protein